MFITVHQGLKGRYLLTPGEARGNLTYGDSHNQITKIISNRHKSVAQNCPSRVNVSFTPKSPMLRLARAHPCATAQQPGDLFLSKLNHLE